MFNDNWEWSAFLYEFQARLHSEPRWEWFGLPWVRLNYSQRGALAAIWSNRVTGSLTIGREQHPFVVKFLEETGAKCRVMSFTVDLKESDAVLVEKFKEQLAGLRKEMNAPNPKEGRPKPPRWKLLARLSQIAVRSSDFLRS